MSLTEHSKRILFLTLGLICTAVGFAGIVLPLLPGTVFLILAAFFFARSSERLHAWLYSLGHVGPALRRWDETGAMCPRHKVIAIGMLWLGIGSTLLFATPPQWVQVLLVVIAASVSVYIYTRPNG